MAKPRSILVPVDFSEYSDQALSQAVEFAKEFKAKIYVLHVVEHKLIQCIDDYCLNEDLIRQMGASKPAQYTDDYSITPNMVKQIEEGMFTAAGANLQRLVNKILEDSEIEIVVEVRKGIPHQEIRQFQKENDIDFIVMPSRGKGGLTEFHLGSTTEKVLRSMPCCITIAKS
jgi:universal stress protein A